MSKLLQAALSYASDGYAVFPVKPFAKVPATRHGLKDATTDPERIVARWRATPQANIGLLPPPRVLVVDVDAAELVNVWQERHPELTQAPLTRTPSGGGHFYLNLPEGVRAPSTATRVNGEPVDIRGLGKAYLVVPPSIRAEGGYLWARELVPGHELPEASGQLLAVLTPKVSERQSMRRQVMPLLLRGDRRRRYALTALRAEHDAVAATPEGGRNCALNRAAYCLGQLVGAGVLERGEVLNALEAAAAICGLPQGEAARTIQSGMEAGVREPRSLPPDDAGLQTERDVNRRSYRAGVYARLRGWR